MPSRAQSSMADELAIRNLVARYADAVWRRDGDAWESGWASDAVWLLPGGKAINGRSDIRAGWERAMSRYPTVVEIVHQGEVNVDGDTGTGRWYLTERGTTIDDDPIDHLGTFDDVYCQVDGVWLFASRRFEVIALGTAGATRVGD